MSRLCEMNSRPLVVAFAAMLAVSLAAAQSEDGDYEVSTGVSTSASPRMWYAGSLYPAYGDLDLTDASVVSETPETIRVEIQVKDQRAGDNPERIPVARTYSISLHVVDLDYQLVFFDDVSPFQNIPPELDQVPFKARLDVLVAGRPTSLAELPVVSGADGNGWAVDIARSLLVGSGREPLIAGSQITNITATSAGVGREYAGCTELGTDAEICGILVRDRLPDEGALPPYTVSSNPTLNGHLLIFSPRPQKVSNGEATTYLYQILVSNVGSLPDVIRFEVAQSQAGWTVILPNDMEVKPGETRFAAVAIQVPFMHRHGVTENASIQVSSSLDAASGRTVTLGVHWLEVPQPAGHHSTLYFHAGAGFDSWVNTLTEDAAATGEGIAFRVSGCVVCGSNSTTIQLLTRPSLRPDLQLGIDAKPGQAGLLHLEVLSDITGDFTLRFEITADIPSEAGGAGHVVLFRAANTPVHLEAGSTAQIDVPLEGTADADYLLVPAPSAFTVSVDLRGTPDGADLVKANLASLHGSAVARLQPTSFIFLPLNEFHDDIISQALASQGIRVLTPRGSSLEVNPGKTRVFEVAIESGASMLDVRATASPSTAVMLSSASIRPGEILLVAVQLDAGARTEFSYDTLLRFEEHGNPSNQAATVLRLEAVSEPAPDDAAEAAGIADDKETALPWPLSLVALGVAIFLSRRR